MGTGTSSTDHIQVQVARHGSVSPPIQMLHIHWNDAGASPGNFESHNHLTSGHTTHVQVRLLPINSHCPTRSCTPTSNSCTLVSPFLRRCLPSLQHPPIVEYFLSVECSSAFSLRHPNLQYSRPFCDSWCRHRQPSLPCSLQPAAY